MSNMSPMESYLRDKVGAKKLPLPLQPSTEPEMPRDLTSISDKDLSILMAEFSGLMAYAGVEAAFAGANYASKKAKYKFEYAKKYVTRQAESTKKVAAKTVEYELDCDDELNRIKVEEVAAEQYKTLVDALYNGYNAKYNVLSRELTRRSTNGQQKEF